MTIQIPPLRDRKEDIPVLIDYLLKKINRDLHKKVAGISSEMMDIFFRYGWPGNIRELENLLVRASVVSKSHILGLEDFPDLLGLEKPVKRTAESDLVDTSIKSRILTLDEIEEKHIRATIERVGRNKGEICEALGISRPTLERKLEKYGISFE